MKPIEMLKKFSVLIGLIALILAYFYYPFKSVNSPIVQTKFGKVVGTVSLSRNGKEFYAYLGIPYASPPVGERRFEVTNRIRVVYVV